MIFAREKKKGIGAVIHFLYLSFPIFAIRIYAHV